MLAARALGGECTDPLALAVDVDGVVDNATAAWHGGVAIHADGAVVRLDPPRSVAPILVIPERSVNTEDARAVLPSEVPLQDAVANAGHAAILGAGIAADDPDLIAKGLRDHLHQQRRADLYPESWQLLADVQQTGALGATISGAGAAVLVWAPAADAAAVAERVSDAVSGWARAVPTGFSSTGTTVDGKGVA